MGRRPSRELTPRQQKFVAAYVSGKSASQSAIDAGYSPTNARSRACELLNRNQLVRNAIEAHRHQLRVEANYNVERAMAELDEAIKFAVATKNATAYARCVELKSKLMGLLTEKKETAQGNGLTINIAGVAFPDAPQNSFVEVVAHE